MSHIVSIQTKVHDPAAIRAACTRLALATPMEGTAELCSGNATGWVVQFPGWRYAAVINTKTGEAQYDNFGGIWGEQSELDRFLQAYAVEKARLEARKKGYAVQEQALQDGSIRLQILEGA